MRETHLVYVNVSQKVKLYNIIYLYSNKVHNI
jgi:hypothetical protein